MSKRSRRRARRRREQMVSPRNLLLAMSRVFASVAPLMEKSLELSGNSLEIMRLMTGTAGTEWSGVVEDAIRRRDSLPILVYADWCDESGCPKRAAHARLVGERMKNRDADNLTLGFARVAEVAANGVHATLNEWRAD